MAFKLTFENGQPVYASDTIKRMESLMRQVGSSGRREVHEMFATTIIPPIKQMADYEEWTKVFFNTYAVQPNDLPRIAVDNPSMVAFYTSPSGEVMFIRPGRTTYLTPSLVMVDCGLEIGWDDLVAAGWPILEQKMSEAGEELARKRDVEGRAVLDAAMVTVSANALTAGGAAMTKAAVDAVFDAANTAGWRIQTVVVNAGDVMDMSNWVWSANHMWDTRRELSDGILRDFYINGYGNANWLAFKDAPAGYVWFTAGPSTTGAYRWQVGGTRTASDIDIKKRVDFHTWDEKYGYYLGNPYGLWRLALTA